MTRRYRLRIDSGARSGEAVRIPSDGLLVGRAPTCDLELAEASVSGRHAELRAGPDGVLVRDLGSTNGTRLGAERLAAPRLAAHGDRVRFGEVAATVLDEDLNAVDPADERTEPGDARGAAAAAAPLPTSSAVAAAEPVGSGAGLGDVGARDALEARVGRIARRGRQRALVGVALALALGAAGLWLARRGAASGDGGLRAPSAAPVEVDGNRLANPSFEDLGDAPDDDDLAGWATSELAPSRLSASPRWRDRGRLGVGAELVAGDWVRLAGEGGQVPSGSGLRASARVRPRGGAQAWVGVETVAATSDGGPPARQIRWSTPTRGGDAFADAEVLAAVPAGAERVRAVLFARAAVPGEVAFDEVALVRTDAPAPVLERDELELRLWGAAASELSLERIERPLVFALAVGPARRERDDGASLLPAAGERSLTVEATEDGFRVRWEGAEDDVLSATLASSLVAAGLSTSGAGGYRPRPAEFEDTGVTSVLAGAAPVMVRLAFDAEVRVRSRSLAGAEAFWFELGPNRGVDLQVSFRDERNRALALARDARELERSGGVGRALSAWNELLELAPYEKELAAEASERRSRLVQAGVDELTRLRSDFEDARFFELADIYRRTRAAARSIAERYAGSEVALAAQRFAEAVEAELAAYEARETAGDGARLEAVAEILEARGAETLASHVRAQVRGPGPGEDGAAGGGR